MTPDLPQHWDIPSLNPFLLNSSNLSSVSLSAPYVYEKSSTENVAENIEESAFNHNHSSLESPKPSYRIDFYRKTNIEIFFATFSWFANLLIFFLIISKKNFRRRTNILIANLCLASVVYISAMNFRALESKLQLEFNYMYHSSGLCGILAVVHRFAIPAMSLTTMAISLERSRSAVATNPRQLLPSKAFAGFKLLLIWSLSMLINIPMAFINVYDEEYYKTVSGNGYSKRKCIKVLLWGNVYVHVVYVVAYSMVVYLVPTMVLVRELVRMQKKMSFLVCRQKPGVTCKNNERLRLVRNSSIFTAIFITFWLPIGCWLTIYDLPGELFPQEWRSNYASVFNYCHLFTNYFVWSIPVVLFLISQNLRESLCQCKCFPHFSNKIAGNCTPLQYVCCCLVCSTPTSSVSEDLQLQTVNDNCGKKTMLRF